MYGERTLCEGDAQNLRRASPEEDGGGPGSQQRGLLGKSLYGTRDAAQNWERDLGGFLEELGLRRGTARSACTPKRDEESPPRVTVMTSLSGLAGQTPSG